MDSKILLPLGLGALALAFVFSQKSSASTPSGSRSEATPDQLDQAFVNGLTAQLNQCWEDGEISSPVSDTDSVVGKPAMDAAALAQSYVTAVLCANRFVDSLGIPEGPDLQQVREDAGTLTRAWIRNLRGADDPQGTIEAQSNEARVEAESDGFVVSVFREALANIARSGTFGLSDLIGAVYV